MADIVGATEIDLDGGTPAGLILTGGEFDNLSTQGLIFDGDATTRISRRVAGVVNCAGDLESKKAVRASQGKPEAITLAEAFITAAGTNSAQNLYIDAKGAAGVCVDTRALATGGTRIGAAASKVGFFGAAAVKQPAVKPAAEVTAQELCEALEALGLIS